MAFRLKKLMPGLISMAQSAFVPQRLIGDNILLAQALFKNYHLNSGTPRCALKIDIKKAFDTLNWGFLLNSLRKMGFPPLFIDWISACLNFCMISVKINGSLEGYFKACSGLRQGDPLSPYLFVLAMEVFTAIINEKTKDAAFKFHYQTKPLAISHLIFADDVMLFCHGDKASIDLLLRGVNDFANVSGLHTNKDKSQCFFVNVGSDIKNHAILASSFQIGSLPIRYLGLPLITTKLKLRDCNPLIMRINSQIENWANKLLNQAGRLQMLKVVFSL